MELGSTTYVSAPNTLHGESPQQLKEQRRRYLTAVSDVRRSLGKTLPAGTPRHTACSTLRTGDGGVSRSIEPIEAWVARRIGNPSGFTGKGVEAIREASDVHKRRTAKEFERATDSTRTTSSKRHLQKTGATQTEHPVQRAAPRVHSLATARLVGESL